MKYSIINKPPFWFVSQHIYSYLVIAKSELIFYSRVFSPREGLLKIYRNIYLVSRFLNGQKNYEPPK